MVNDHSQNWRHSKVSPKPSEELRGKGKPRTRTEEFEEATTASVGQCSGDEQRMQTRTQSTANGNLRDKPALAGPLKQPYLDQRNEPASAGPQISRNTQSGNHVY